MGSWQDYHQSNNGGPLSFLYGDYCSFSSSQSAQQIAFDYTSRRQQPDQHFVINPSATSLPVHSFDLDFPTKSLQSSIIWTDPNNATQLISDPMANPYDDLSQVLPWLVYDPRILKDKNGHQSSDKDLELARAQPYVGMSMCQSPVLELLPTKGHNSDDGEPTSSRERTTMDDDGHATHESYAKLIHRALLSRANYSMDLQEIYEWVRDNTGKCSAIPESEGWKNSIRHNLSMNGAFIKTERKNPGHKTKISPVWKLADFAVKGGVQSTARYRPKPKEKRRRPRYPTTPRNHESVAGARPHFLLKQEPAVRSFDGVACDVWGTYSDDLFTGDLLV